MDPELWRRNIKEDLAWIADEAHQREIWFPGSETWNFPDEMLNWLDDHVFADFIESPQIGLNSAQREKAEEFWRQWLDFLQGTPQSVGFELVDDPRWARIRILSKELHDML